jgi:hypothetical protein
MTMTRFLDGPAMGQAMNLTRAPVFLRAVVSLEDGLFYKDGKWDALDKLEDTPANHERIFAYKLDGEPTRGFVDGTNYRGPFFIATYRYFPNQPPDDVMRDNAKWQEWANKQTA